MYTIELIACTSWAQEILIHTLLHYMVGFNSLQVNYICITDCDSRTIRSNDLCGGGINEHPGTLE